MEYKLLEWQQSRLVYTSHMQSIIENPLLDMNTRMQAYNTLYYFEVYYLTYVQQMLFPLL
jgi:hypothetical protein